MFSRRHTQTSGGGCKCPEALWSRVPNILLEQWYNVWPFDENDAMNTRINAATRLLFVTGVAATLLTRKVRFMGYSIVASLALLLLGEKQACPHHRRRAPRLAQHNAVDDYTAPLETLTPPYLHGTLGHHPTAPAATKYGHHDATLPDYHQYRTFEPRPFGEYPVVNTNDLGNEQTNFGFDSAVDPSHSVNRETEEYAEGVGRHAIRSQQQTSDMRSEAYQGVVPQYDAFAAMQMAPEDIEDDDTTNNVISSSDLGDYYETTAHSVNTGTYEPGLYTPNALVSRDNPYGNPHNYQVYDAAVMPSTRQPDEVDVHKMAKDHAQRDQVKMYYGAGELDEGLFVNPLPDPTLMARPVFFPESSEWDRHIVGQSVGRYGMIV